MTLAAALICAALILLSAFFVLAEFAAVRIRETQLEALAEEDPRALRALEIHRGLSHHLSAIQAGIVLCALALGAVGEEMFSHAFHTLFGHLPWPKLVVPLSTALALLVMTTLHVVLAELVPRSLAIRSALPWALRTATPLLAWSRLVRPLTWGLTKLSHLVLAIFGVHPEADAEDLLPSEAEFRRMLERSQAQGHLELDRKELIENLFDFSRRMVKEIAVPRARVVCFDLTRSLADNLALARTTPHTRIPLVEGDLDRVVGVIHLKELLWAMQDTDGAVDLRELARPPFFVPEMKPIQGLLLEFQQRKQHLALVVDEHGGVDGLVTLEDVLEELVGEIQDEFDREAIQLRKTRGGAWLAQGNVMLEQLEDHLQLCLEAEAGSVSLGGFFQERLGRVLRPGDELRLQGWRIRVLSMRGRAPGQFLLKPLPPEPAAPEA
ncbi:MAG: HlyC/CorC family transporter [Geothrix sp.]|uniref:HlyC/CorC family transporter n=1 Tax=Candidatus Geothrix odensensis TaxID=2954440 RepID=A0A936F0U3_9BACT|nr:HlyC/CorC family transporter [Candidatus Geothrix odensensis]MCC6512565.1 HlyC/CorC family transporter [Geothrix sp.]